MIIRVERSGGFAGMTVRAMINTEDLDPEEGRNLIDLVETSGFFDYALESHSEQQGRDRFHYSITIEYKEEHRTVDLDESQIPENWQNLIQNINQLARRYRT